jgi:hypothetical protein
MTDALTRCLVGCVYIRGYDRDGLLPSQLNIDTDASQVFATMYIPEGVSSGGTGGSTLELGKVLAGANGVVTPASLQPS